MLKIENINFTRPQNRSQNLVFSYDFSLSEGEILAVQGPSGVGKTTLLDLIAGFEVPDKGIMSWNDSDFTALPPWERPVTTVFQADNLFSHLTCRQNIAIGFTKSSFVSEAEIDAGFERLGIAGLQSRLPDEISGGQQQRVALVRAMLRDRPVLLLDESFSALDWESRCGCFDALTEMTRNRAMCVVIVSHDERDAEYLGCRTLRLTH